METQIPMEMGNHKGMGTPMEMGMQMETGTQMEMGTRMEMRKLGIPMETGMGR